MRSHPVKISLKISEQNALLVFNSSSTSVTFYMKATLAPEGLNTNDAFCSEIIRKKLYV